MFRFISVRRNGMKQIRERKRKREKDAMYLFTKLEQQKRKWKSFIGSSIWKQKTGQIQNLPIDEEKWLKMVEVENMQMNLCFN